MKAAAADVDKYGRITLPGAIHTDAARQRRTSNTTCTHAISLAAVLIIVRVVIINATLCRGATVAITYSVTSISSSRDARCSLAATGTICRVVVCLAGVEAVLVAVAPCPAVV